MCVHDFFLLTRSDQGLGHRKEMRLPVGDTG